MPKKYPVEKRLEVVLAGLRSEDSIREICRQHEIETKTYYKWKHAFMEGGKQGLSGDDVEPADNRAKELKIEQVRTAYRHPETNGRLERFHLTLKDATVRLETGLSALRVRRRASP